MPSANVGDASLPRDVCRPSSDRRRWERGGTRVTSCRLVLTTSVSVCVCVQLKRTLRGYFGALHQDSDTFLRFRGARVG